jgi:hypothetical protein
LRHDKITRAGKLPREQVHGKATGAALHARCDIGRETNQIKCAASELQVQTCLCSFQGTQ